MMQVVAATSIRDDVIARLSAAGSELRLRNVGALYLFGSVARKEDRPGSDVDILVEFDRPVGIFAFIELKAFMANLLGRDVDLATRGSLKPLMRDEILRSLIRAA